MTRVFSVLRAIRFTTTQRFQSRYSSSSASVIADDHTLTTATAGETAGVSQQHPWPEWMTFVKRLKAKGFIILNGGNDVAIYKNMSVIKNACLNFGLHRFDLFKWLSMKDIQTLVEKGCPNINGNVVNSGKRLRAHLQLDEADACGVCVFRGSCHRAYVMLKDVEPGAQTEDVMLILLSYALDPAVVSDKKPFWAEVVSTCAKKLLLKLTKLSYKRVRPEWQKLAAPIAPKRNVRMSIENWRCSKCNFLNFARFKKCRECNEDVPYKADDEEVKMKKGDWICHQCNLLNFSGTVQCMKCKTKRVTNGTEMKIGDWICLQCRFLNFASNKWCLNCKRHPRRYHHLKKKVFA